VIISFSFDKRIAGRHSRGSDGWKTDPSDLKLMILNRKTTSGAIDKK
jgi:hypothetical protein